MSVIYRVRTFNEYVNQMKNYLIAKNSKLNNFNVGSRLLTTIESIATVLTSDSSEFYSALKKSIPVATFSAFDFFDIAGKSSTGTIEFYKIDNAVAQLPIPIGTKVQLNGYIYETTSAGSIDIGNTHSGNISAKSSLIGIETNIGIGDIDTRNGKGIILNPPSGIEYAVNNTAFENGTTNETEEQKKERFINYVNGLARSNVYGILTGLDSLNLFSYNVRNGFPEWGTITVYAEDSAGLLSETKKAEIEKVMLGDINDPENYKGYIAYGIGLNVLSPEILPTNFKFYAYVKTGSKYEDVDLANALVTSIETALTTFINSGSAGENFQIVRAENFIMNYDSEIFDVEYRFAGGGVNPVSRADNIVATETQVIRTGPSVGASVDITLVVVDE